jgi:hypothetical protein
MNSFGSVNVITGPIALKLNSGWVGVASGNRYSEKTRRTPGKAIQDAIKISQKHISICDKNSGE